MSRNYIFLKKIWKKISSEKFPQKMYLYLNLSGQATPLVVTRASRGKNINLHFLLLNGHRACLPFYYYQHVWFSRNVIEILLKNAYFGLKNENFTKNDIFIKFENWNLYHFLDNLHTYMDTTKLWDKSS